MIILLHGPDTYRARQRVHFYRDGFKKKYDPQGLNVAFLNGEKLTTEDFRKNVGQIGFLADKRFIVVENLISKNSNKKIQEEVIDYLDTDWSDDNVLVFLEEDADSGGTKGKGGGISRKPLFKRLSKEKVESFTLLTGEQLSRWIRAEVKRIGGLIEDPAVLGLASFVGSDLWSMSSEIEKLVGYRGSTMIRAKDVREFVRAKFDDNIFHLTDALAAKDAKRSFSLLSDQIASGSHELYILTMLIRQFRILLQVRELIDKEPNHYAVASRLKLHPFVAQKAIRDAKKFTLNELRDIFKNLLDIDVKIKTTQDSPRLLFDLLITRVCSLI